MREASSFTRRHGWAGQSSPAVRGVLTSAAFDVGIGSSEAGAAHRAPRPDLLYRLGGGAFKRLWASAAEASAARRGDAAR